MKIEDVSLDNPLITKAMELLPKMKVGQSVVVPREIWNAVRQRAVVLPGKFGSRRQADGTFRIGRTR